MSKYLQAILIFILCLVIFFDKCGSKPEPINLDKTDSLKAVIRTLNVQKDKLLYKAKTSDSVRVETIIKYRYLKGSVDTVPCAEVLPQIIIACDSIITKDSLHIVDLKNVIKNDSTIITLQNEVITNDSITKQGLNKRIVKLEKKVKRRGNIIKLLTATNLTTIFLIFANK